MKYQRNNGSFFNSPATTAAAFQHLKNADCLSYLQSVLEKYGNAGMISNLHFCIILILATNLFCINLTYFFFLTYSVPTVYPLDIYARLYMIDSLECLGIDRHFEEEIQCVLDETYR